MWILGVLCPDFAGVGVVARVLIALPSTSLLVVGICRTLLGRAWFFRINWSWNKLFLGFFLSSFVLLRPRGDCGDFIIIGWAQRKNVSWLS